MQIIQNNLFLLIINKDDIFSSLNSNKKRVTGL